MRVPFFLSSVLNNALNLKKKKNSIEGKILFDFTSFSSGSRTNLSPSNMLPCMCGALRNSSEARAKESTMERPRRKDL